MYGNRGCLGGNFEPALQIAINQGIALEKDYPYKGLTKDECQTKTTG